MDRVRVAARVEIAAARFVTGWPVAKVVTLAIGVTERQVQR